MFGKDKSAKISIKWTVSIILLIISMKLYNIFFTENNACTTWEDYMSVDTSSNCYHNPDVGANTPEILTRLFGYYENHTVLTEDGFYIRIFRVPHPNPRGVVILQHPVTIDAIVWVGQNDTSLAYLLWKKGYDVWMPNQRGTYFSNKHVNYTIDDFEFWDYTFEEIGLYDYSAVFKHISNETARNDLIFIGHSMATTASLIYASLKPDEAQQYIKIFIELSPTASLKHMTSGLRNINEFIPKLIDFYRQYGIHHVFRFDGAWGKFVYLIGHFPLKGYSGRSFNSIMGTSVEEFDPQWHTVLHTQIPRAFSGKLAVHYCQLTVDDFRRYNYGPEENLRRYNSTVPPEYPVWNIKTPVYLITSRDDTIATVEDSEILYNKLSDEAKIYGRNITHGVNHIEFHFGKNKVKYVYEKIYEILERIEA